ncbi:N-acetylneuraminate synthase family protein [Candidatus Woesearchaeota archaeon]|nr:N-acetylneuraminate synthase family protein [Candidatus Woesearchaeota archaeon]
MVQITVNGKELNYEKSYIIAEIASAHCGSMEKLKSIIASSAKAGVDAIKFQMFNVDYFVSKFHLNYANNKKNQFSPEQWKEIFTFAQQFLVDIWADVFDEGSADLAEPFVHGFKLHSTDVTNPFMLEYVAKKNKPLILAAGGASLEELKKAVHKISSAGNTQIILSHGFQAYPTDISKVNLNRLKVLQKEFPDCLIGYHDHTNGELPAAITIPVAAFAFGAAVIEKHVTDERSLKGFDYESSLNPTELKHLVEQIRAFESCKGSDSFVMSDEEKKYRDYTKRYVVANKALKAGDIISLSDLAFKRSHPKGIGASEYVKIVGRKVQRDLQADETILPQDVQNKVAICLAVRLKSTRLPKKAILDIVGQTAIEHQIDRLKKCQNGELILCTSTLDEDAPLIEIAHKKNIRYFAGSPDDVMERFLQAAKLIEANVIVRTTGDCPLIDHQIVDQIIEHHLRTGADYTGIEETPIGFEAEAIHVSTLLEARTRVKEAKDTEFMTWFIKDPKHFKIEILPVPEAIKRNYRMTLDTPADLQAITEVFKALA